MSFNIEHETSPVKAPLSSSCTFCASTCRCDDSAARAQASSDVNGTQMPMSSESFWSMRGSSPVTYERASARSLFIFQLPAMYARRSGIVQDLHARQALAFEQFERRTAAGRQVINTVGETELVQCGSGVAAADDGGAGRVR